MDLLKPITLPIYHHNEQTQDYAKLDIDYDLTLCTVRNQTFYEVNSLADFVNTQGNDELMSKIYANGSYFFSPMVPEKVREIINPFFKAEIEISPGDEINNFNDWWQKVGFEFEKYGVGRIFAQMIWRESNHVNNVNRLERLADKVEGYRVRVSNTLLQDK